MNGKILIRDFREEDMEKILEYREEVAGISFPVMKFSKESSRKAMLKGLEKHPGSIRIAELDGKIAGFIIFRPKKLSLEESGSIESIFVHKDYRKRGIAKLLLETAEEWFRKKGIRHISATVTNTNLPSMELFSKSGYREKRTVFEKVLEW
jgi:phosphinothricin acetyltransferase